MIDKDDWRLTNQMNYLFEKQLQHIRYKPQNSEWDHDHCEFCNCKITIATGKAYCTLDQYHWICDNCFSDFCELFKWTVI